MKHPPWQEKESKIPPEEVVRMRTEEQLTMEQIAKQFGCSKTVILHVLRKQGIQGRLPKQVQRRKCLHCGKLYYHNELIEARPICPHCWGPERFVMVGGKNNGKGKHKGETAKHKAFRETMEYKRELGLDSDTPWHVDKGCEEAKTEVGHPVSCLDCPLPECISVEKDNGHQQDKIDKQEALK